VSSDIIQAMNSNTKKEIVLIIAILAIIIGFRYQQYMVQRNFTLDVNVACVAGEQGCFAMDCSPEESEDCDTATYKKVNILASEAPQCLEEHSCEAFSCTGLANCSIILCDDESIEDGEMCSIVESSTATLEASSLSESEEAATTESLNKTQ
jgi:hypothetical protein